ncbi:TetR/AcrR family transcriptional regulator [Paenibacillus dokdonensis]|uniref:TetR/AcrR family transcriptional regulator n=1 Tax=Paenibacillus dokdonensis TaxID=2567944 RepID=A0ABU6GVU2_9BACL|nr:TetR/AcrR family transcriptional regulator [Paenibacillus dokdonensis]MEC0242287.1 TetR/AcrR family transcriptional regulator [Paenibacillus dokdonensis]
MTSHQQRIDPRVVRTQRLLKNALFDLLEERGYEQVTVQDIADRATVKRATFYLHFNDKQDLLHQCITDLLNELSESIKNKNDDTLHFDFHSGKTHPIFIRMFEHVSEHFCHYQALLVNNRIPAFTSGLLDVLHNFISEGINMTEPDDSNLSARRDVVIKYVESAYLELIIWWVENQMPYPEKDMAEMLMNLSIMGPYRVRPYEKTKP